MAISIREFHGEHDIAYIECIQDIIQEHNPHALLDIQGDDESAIHQWIRKQQRKHHWHSKDEAAIITYWILDEETVIGIATLKSKLSCELYADSGHIGICIRRGYRQNGYARAALMKMIQKAHEHGIADIMLCCTYDNMACRKLCESVHAVLKHENSYCHYWLSEHIDQVQDA